MFTGASILVRPLITLSVYLPIFSLKADICKLLAKVLEDCFSILLALVSYLTGSSFLSLFTTVTSTPSLIESVKLTSWPLSILVNSLSIFVYSNSRSVVSFPSCSVSFSFFFTSCNLECIACTCLT